MVTVLTETPTNVCEVHKMLGFLSYYCSLLAERMTEVYRTPSEKKQELECTGKELCPTFNGAAFQPGDQVLVQSSVEK